MLKNTLQKWGPVAQGLHWVIAGLFVLMWLTAEVMMTMVVDPQNTFFGFTKYEVYGWHKSFGVVVMILVAVRLVWRGMNRAPAEGMMANKWEKRLAHLGHLALYGVMILMPLSGYTMSMAGGHGVKMFGIPVPNIYTLLFENGKNIELASFAYKVHGTTFEVFWFLIALHVGAALYHYYVKRDNVLQRMLPVRKK